MGIVLEAYHKGVPLLGLEAYHKGVPLLGVPENPIDLGDESNLLI